MSPLIPVITILMLLMVALCIINCLTHFVSAQVNKLQHAVPVQQQYINLHPTTENITHPQMDTALRTLRLESSKRGRSNAPHHPSSAGISQRDLGAPIPKELGLLSLEGGILGHQKKKKESKTVVAKRQRKVKVCKNRTKENAQNRVKTSGETNIPPSWPAQFAQGRLKVGRRQINKRRKPRWIEVPPLEAACTYNSRMYYPLFFQIQLSCNQAVTLVSNFKFLLL